jgi:hypothetical protein
MTIRYQVTIGSTIFNNRAQPGLGQHTLVALDTELGTGGIGGECRVQLGHIGVAQPRLGDRVIVELDAGDGAVTVFTGEVTSINQQVAALNVRAQDSLAKLAHTEVESAYEEVSVGFIVQDLIAQAGGVQGQIEEGPTLPSYVVHRGPRALRHAQRLGNLIGAELFTDGEGKIHFQRPAEGGTISKFRWGQDLIGMDLRQHRLVCDSMTVWGEGAAGNQGPERGHWLPTDLSGVNAKAMLSAGVPGEPGEVIQGSLGELPRTAMEGAVRSAETAADLVRARMQAKALRPLTGHAWIPGQPGITPGQWIEFFELPKGDGAADGSLKLRVRRVHHHFSLDHGLVSRLEF